MAPSKFPWDVLKAESLRMLSRELGFSSLVRRDVMISFLKSVEEHGLQDALQLAKPQPTPPKRSTRATVPSTPETPKRKREPVISDYNTRHKDKRVRLSDPGPRKKTVRVGKAFEGASPKKPRVGRQTGGLKSAMKQNTSTRKADRRQIFDGVVLQRTALSEKVKGKARAQDLQGDDTTDQREVGSTGGSDDLGLNPQLSREPSSLAGSNKENELFFEQNEEVNEDPPAGYQAERETAENGETDPSAQRVFEQVAEVLGEITDEDLDAEGEIVAEPDGVTVAHPGETVQVDIAQPYMGVAELSEEDVSQIQQFLAVAVENGHAV